jgi:adenylate kinase
MNQKHIGLIFGPNGVGKGTLATKLAGNFEYIHLNMGNLIREWIKYERHAELQELLDAGELIADEYIKEILDYEYPRMALNRKFKNIVFEGMPRRISQVEILKKFCEYHDYSIRWIIVLDAPLDVILERVSQRVIAPDGNVYHLTYNPPPARYTPSELQTRPDDRPDVVRRRYEEYVSNSLACVSDPFFDGVELLRIDGTKGIEEVYQQAQVFLQKMIAVDDVIH